MNKILILNNIKKNLTNFDNKEEKLLYLIYLSKFLPNISKQYHTNKYLIKECQSNVWLYINIKKINHKKYLYLFLDSDSLIIKGLLFIIFSYYQTKSLEEIINSDIFLYFKSIHILEELSTIKQNGIKSVINKILIFVRQ